MILLVSKMRWSTILKQQEWGASWSQSLASWETKHFRITSAAKMRMVTIIVFRMPLKLRILIPIQTKLDKKSWDGRFLWTYLMTRSRKPAASCQVPKFIKRKVKIGKSFLIFAEPIQRSWWVWLIGQWYQTTRCSLQHHPTVLNTRGQFHRGSMIQDHRRISQLS